MSMVADQPRKTFRATVGEIEAAQRNFDFLMPYKKALLTTPEVAGAIRREQDFVRQLAEEGRLEVHSDTAFGKPRVIDGSVVKPRESNRYTRRSVLVYYARTAQYEPAQFLDFLDDLFQTLTPDQLRKVSAKAMQALARRPL